jgi:hypothetical protein
MGIFKNLTKSLKKAAPLIGSAIGMYYGGSFGAALGSGIGSLAGGRSVEEALKNAALTGATSYALGGRDFGKDFNFSTSGSPFLGRDVVGGASSSQYGFGAAGAPTKIATDYPAMKGSSFLSSLIPESTMGKVALAGGIGALALGGPEEQKFGISSDRPYPKGESRAGMGLVDGIAFDLTDDDQRAEYFKRIREKQGFKDKEDEEKSTMFANQGGEVTGPGTGTSDSVPARLSDGEFVVTAKAVRGAGGGDRDLGAARMYDMMSQLERVA